MDGLQKLGNINGKAVLWKKINSASDDAAGFAISERMTTQVRGLNKVVQNINDAISLVSTAQGTTRRQLTSFRE